MQTSDAPLEPLKSRVDVLNQLRGQAFEIKDLNKTFLNWPFKVNEHVDEARKEVEAWLDRTFPGHPKLRALKAGDFGFSGATWWPLASFPRLQTAIHLVVWLFLLDDEIDTADGKFFDDVELATKYREDTLRFVKSRLGLPDSADTFTTGNQIIDSFADIGEALKKSCSVEQRKRFVAELSYFIEKSKVEQSLRLAGHIISLEEFWAFRLGTSAVGFVLCLNEYCNEIELPASIMQSPEMEQLWNLTNFNICMVNDLLSIRKEIEHGSAESLVPILYATRRNVQAVADELMNSIKITITDFDSTAAQLLKRRSGEKEGTIDAKDIERFIEGCRYYCTGNVSWSLVTGRYGVYQELGASEILIQM